MFLGIESYISCFQDHNHIYHAKNNVNLKIIDQKLIWHMYKYNTYIIEHVTQTNYVYTCLNHRGNSTKCKTCFHQCVLLFSEKKICVLLVFFLTKIICVQVQIHAYILPKKNPLLDFTKKKSPTGVIT